MANQQRAITKANVLDATNTDINHSIVRKKIKEVKEGSNSKRTRRKLNLYIVLASLKTCIRL